MDYAESKIKGIIREAIVKSLMDIRIESLKRMGNPYATINCELSEEEAQTINQKTDDAHVSLKQKGLLK